MAESGPLIQVFTSQCYILYPKCRVLTVIYTERGCALEMAHPF